MKPVHWLWLVLVACIVAGCKDGATDSSKTTMAKTKSVDDIEANFAKLDPADRKLAEAQKWCAVAKDSRLGSMGTPYKVMIKDQPVFLCCDHCKKQALANPDKTLAKVEELKKKSATP
ncbi:MAG TPA: hypothetical protein VFE62_12070 [Gemmataceae bacterium]|nr:hypothetical protein [Gemmataceae bacterium]